MRLPLLHSRRYAKNCRAANVSEERGMGDLKRKDYEALLEPLQEELAAAARWIAEKGRRLLVIFEGRDTAGKGGAIGAIADQLNPLQCRTVALPKPSDDER